MTGQYTVRNYVKFGMLDRGHTTFAPQLKAAGYLLIVVTNQPDVGRGTQQQSVVEAMHELLQRELPLDAIYVCYHGYDDE